MYKKIKQLSQKSIDKILKFHEDNNYEDTECCCFFGICTAAAEGDNFLNDYDYDYLYEMKYKYGIKLLKRIKSSLKKQE